MPSGSYQGSYYYLDDGMGSVAALTDSSGTVKNTYTYDPLGSITSSPWLSPVPNPFTFQGWEVDSRTGYYYTDSGYYDPANGQSFGCKDKGWVDPGEDLCGEDEGRSAYCANAASHGQSGPRQCGAKQPEEEAPFTGGGAPNGEELGPASEPFSEGWTDNAVKSANEQYKGSRTTYGVRALMKHRGQAVFEGIPVTQGNVDELIQNIVGDSSQIYNVNGKYYDIFNAEGQGVRITISGRFITFLEWRGD